MQQAPTGDRWRGKRGQDLVLGGPVLPVANPHNQVDTISGPALPGTPDGTGKAFERFGPGVAGMAERLAAAKTGVAVPPVVAPTAALGAETPPAVGAPLHHATILKEAMRLQEIRTAGPEEERGAAEVALRSLARAEFALEKPRPIVVQKLAKFGLTPKTVA